MVVSTWNMVVNHPQKGYFVMFCFMNKSWMLCFASQQVNWTTGWDVSPATVRGKNRSIEALLARRYSLQSMSNHVEPMKSNVCIYIYCTILYIYTHMYIGKYIYINKWKIFTYGSPFQFPAENGRHCAPYRVYIWVIYRVQSWGSALHFVVKGWAQHFLWAFSGWVSETLWKTNSHFATKKTCHSDSLLKSNDILYSKHRNMGFQRWT